jgi:hypothetical protein
MDELRGEREPRAELTEDVKFPVVVHKPTWISCPVKIKEFLLLSKPQKCGESYAQK